MTYLKSGLIAALIGALCACKAPGKQGGGGGGGGGPKPPEPMKKHAPQLGRGTFRVVQNNLVTAWVWRAKDLATNTPRLEYWVLRVDPTPAMAPFTSFVSPDQANQDVSMQFLFVPASAGGIKDHADYAAFLQWIQDDGDVSDGPILSNELGTRLVHVATPVP